MLDWYGMVVLVQSVISTASFAGVSELEGHRCYQQRVPDVRSF